MVGQPDDRLLIPFVTHLRPSEHDLQVGAQAAEDAEEFERGAGVPNIDAQSEDFWGSLQQGFRDLQGALVDVELQDLGPRLQFSQVGHEAAQPEGGVEVLRVEGGQNDVRHAEDLTGFSDPCLPMVLSLQRLRSPP